MIINRLEMFNFRQYIGLQSVEFSTDKDKNVTVLIGVNTSGKQRLSGHLNGVFMGKTDLKIPFF